VRLIADQVLSVDILEEIIARTLAAAAKTNPAEHLAQLQRELRSVESQIPRYVEAIGRGGDVPELASALKRSQARRSELTQTIAALERQREQLKQTGLREDIEKRVGDWRALMLRHMAQARQILRKMKVAIRFEPIEHEGEVGYRFHGTASISGLLAGLPLLVSSPSGFGAAGGLRRSAPQTGRPMEAKTEARARDSSPSGFVDLANVWRVTGIVDRAA
jgi:hypothetical protein